MGIVFQRRRRRRGQPIIRGSQSLLLKSALHTVKLNLFLFFFFLFPKWVSELCLAYFPTLFRSPPASLRNRRKEKKGAQKEKTFFPNAL